MSCDTAIRVEGLGKCYHIYDRPRDRLFQMFLRGRKQYYREFWALNDVSFEVRRGESVGVIGRNGSGKSTLLQLVCGTLNATMGRIKTTGRIAALLELGSGFNPEFTGRENVNLNAAVLGLSKEEIAARFDDIAAFADIGQFMEQPVRTYSTGMMLRLAFAVQAQINPDILIVDEALAVGDALFQKKCFMTLNKLRANGSTILFVSHDIATVKSLTEKALLLHQGKVVEYGPSPDVCLRYNQMLFGSNGAAEDITRQQVEASAPAETLTISPERKKDGYGRGCAEIRRIEILGLGSRNVIKGGEKITINVHCTWDIEEVLKIVNQKALFGNINIGLLFQNVKHISIFGFNSLQRSVLISPEQQNAACVSFDLTVPDLAADDYFISSAIVIGDQEHHEILAWHEDIVHLKCESAEKNVFGILDVDVKARVLQHSLTEL